MQGHNRAWEVQRLGIIALCNFDLYWLSPRTARTLTASGRAGPELRAGLAKAPKPTRILGELLRVDREAAWRSS
jgi:hypothetical protein